MMKVGITGGIGSGKSTVCRLFAARGVAVYDSDTEAKRKAIEKAMGAGLADAESVNYTVSDEDMLRRLYGL